MPLKALQHIDQAKLLKYALFCSWIVSLMGVIGSLYFSEILGWLPCEFCWYQRILLYPLALVQGIAFFRRDYQQAIYILPFALMGIVVSLYHFLMQKFPAIELLIRIACAVPNTGAYINWFGFITIPFLSLVSFIAIAFLTTFILLVENGKLAFVKASVSKNSANHSNTTP